MIIQSFLILAPLFVVTLAGFLLDRLYSLSEETLVRVITDFFFPLLVFSSLYSSTIEVREAVKILGSTAFVAAALLGLSYLYCGITKKDPREFVPPVVFMNSGFLGIPLMKLWGGFTAMNLIVVLDQVQTFFIFTAGIIVVSGGFSAKGLKEMIKSPLLWAIVLGFIFKFGKIPLPAKLLEVLEFGGSAASALAIFTLGCSLSKRKLELDPHILAGLILRFLGGFLAGLVAAYLFGIRGYTAVIVVVAASLPSAIFSFVLPARYGVKPQFAGSLVFISTVLGVFTIPIAFSLAEMILLK